MVVPNSLVFVTQERTPNNESATDPPCLVIFIQKLFEMNVLRNI